jgi:transcriptional regulator with XRE-family HTH domain
MAINIGKLIKQVAESKGYTQKRLATSVSTTQQNISNLYNRGLVDYDLLSRLTIELDYNFLAPFFEEDPYLKYKQQEIAVWQAKIDVLTEKLDAAEKLLAAKEELIVVQRQLIKEWEEKNKKSSL